MSILRTSEVSVRFGGHLALDSVSLSVDEGAITGLIGTTRGQVELDGVDISKRSAHKRARLGIARTFQRLELFGSLSVLDNVVTAAELNRTPGTSPHDVAHGLLERVGLVHAAGGRADELTTGNARLLELARALACRPRVLLLDEPASGLDEDETDTFARILLDLTTDGLGILLVEHDVPLVMRLCHQITVLNFGRVLAAGTPAEVQRNPEVVDAYLGQGTDVGATS